MKPLRILRLALLLVLAGLALWVAQASDGTEEDRLAEPAARPRTAHAAASTAPTAAMPASAAPKAVPAQISTPARPSTQAPPVHTENPAAAARAAALAALDTALIARRSDAGATAANAFAPKSWFIAPPAPPPADEVQAPAAPPPPQAPPLPFKYMGSMQETPERTVWYLMNGDRLVVAGSGDVIDASYRLDGAAGGQLRFTYLPLQQRQTLLIGVPP